jgi:hypothetical protein
MEHGSELWYLEPASDAPRTVYRTFRSRGRDRAAFAWALLVGAAVGAVIGLAVRHSASVQRALASSAGRSAAARGAPAAPTAQDPASRSLTPREIAATLPFPPPRADRPPRADEIVSLYAGGLACSTGCRPWHSLEGWPLTPFKKQHPLRAGLNELRPGSLHVGVDIQAPDGADVYALQPGYARVLQASGPDARIQVGNYVYWHINPLVRSGQSIVPFQTPLGTVMAGYGHLALSELGPAGQYLNPLRPLGGVLRPLVDRAPPIIGAPAVAADGQVLVEAYDRQTFLRRTTYLTPVLAPAGLAYRLYDARGTALTPLEWAFRGTHLLPWTARALIYAPSAHAPGYACFATRTVCRPKWTYRLAGGLAPPLPRRLTPGRYRLSIYAWDWLDNEIARDVKLTLTAAGWSPIGKFPAALLSAPGWAPYTSGYGHTAISYSGVPYRSRQSSVAVIR